VEHTVFLTGASAGIGAAIARRFAREGARLVLVARRLDHLEALARELPVPTHLLAVDIQDRPALLGAIAALPAEFAAVTVLVNNAGLALGMAPADALDLDDAETMIDTNIKGLLACTRALLPGMIERGRGHVINLGSVAGTYPYPGGNVYAGTKAFVHQLSLGMRADLLGKNIRVTSVEPGMVETDFSLVRFKGDEARARAVYQDFQALSPDDIAESVAWCANLPPHVNINRLEVMATNQSFSPFALKRG
jgi:NADP-dependent 3-hydroxy acid dehydrogenase YdfG